jgi:hypothetical protein
MRAALTAAQIAMDVSGDVPVLSNQQESPELYLGFGMRTLELLDLYMT